MRLDAGVQCFRAPIIASTLQEVKMHGIDLHDLEGVLIFHDSNSRSSAAGGDSTAHLPPGGFYFPGWVPNFQPGDDHLAKDRLARCPCQRLVDRPM